MIAPMDTSEMYLKADIDFASESGKMNITVVPTTCNTLKRVTSPPPGEPVISGDTPKLLQQITNSFVTTWVKKVKSTDDLVRDASSEHEGEDTDLQEHCESFAACFHSQL